MHQTNPNNVVQISGYSREPRTVSAGDTERLVADREIAQGAAPDYADNVITTDSEALNAPINAPESAAVKKEEDTGMTDGVTRGELDAKLQTIEARMDGRITRMESLVKSSIAESKEMRQEVKETKRHIDLVVLAGVGVMVAIVAIAATLMQGEFDTTNSWLQMYLTHIGALVSHLPTAPHP